MAAEWIKHEGGCHCGRVRFHVLALAELEVREANAHLPPERIPPLDCAEG